MFGFGLALSKDGASTNPIMVALLEHQPKIFDDACKPIVATPAGIEALELQAAFLRQKVTSPEAAARTSDDNQDLFIGGRLAIVVGGSSRVVSNREKAAWGWSDNVVFLPAQCNFGAMVSDLNVATQKVVQGGMSALDALKEVEALGAERQ